MDPRTIQPEPRARLLSFDGGGIRGLFALQYAKRIETLLREKPGNPNAVLADHFHYVAGTSTGAIIAAFVSWGLPVHPVRAARHRRVDARHDFRVRIPPPGRALQPVGKRPATAAAEAVRSEMRQRGGGGCPPDRATVIKRTLGVAGIAQEMNGGLTCPSKARFHGI